MSTVDEKSDEKLDEKLIWEEISKTQTHRAMMLTVNETTSRSPDGFIEHYTVIDTADWAIVIPVRGDNFVMVKQWRHGEKSLSIEFPGGVIDKGETPEQAAVRELLEETGCTAEKITKLGSVSPNPALMSNHVHIFLAENLSEPHEQKLDKDEYVQRLEIAQQEVLSHLGTKTYPHALMTAAAALYMAHENQRRGS